MADALLTVENLSKSFGDKQLFEDISFGINAGQKSALIARNGAGKSTLLNILMTAYGHPGYNTLQDSGKVTFSNHVRLAYLPQNPLPPAHAQLPTPHAILHHIPRPETEDPWTFELRLEEIVSRMKVSPLLHQPLNTLSGGEQKKVALCQLLLDNTNLIILDEPTNHLDIDIIEWLEDFLARQRLALLLVTHDRYFLDNVCDNIFELADTHLYHYKGHYDYYLEKKAEREANQRAEVAKARSLYRTELEWMRRMPQARGTKAQARIDNFYQLQAKAHTRFDDTKAQFTVRTQRLGGKILELYNITFRHPDGPNPGRELISDFSYTFKRGEKIGIVGPNGIGKTTLLNIITQQLRPSSGRVVVGQTIQFGYYTQAGMQAPPDRRVIDLVKDIAEEIEIENGKTLSAHQFLSHFGFDSTTQFNYFANLSGGEKRRLHLLQILIANPNFLILDEPTNDLDLYTLQILEQFLQAYQGCLIIVSHDRSFMDHIVDHLFVFEGNGRIRDYHSDYTHYRLNKAQELKNENAKQREKTTPKTENTPQPRPQSPEPKKRLTFKEQQEYQALTAEIEALTHERASLEEQLSNGTLTSHTDITQAATRIGEIISLLDQKELRWLELDQYAS